MDKIIYKSTFHAEAPSTFGLSLYDNVAVITELPDNPGMSVTGAVEAIANIICEQYNIKPGELIYIEHYVGTPVPLEEQDNSGYIKNPRDETFDIVEFERPDNRTYLRFKLINPKWQPLTRKEAELLIGKDFYPDYENPTRIIDLIVKEEQEKEVANIKMMKQAKEAEKRYTKKHKHKVIDRVFARAGFPDIDSDFDDLHRDDV
jgi:hypothetical protein